MRAVASDEFSWSSIANSISLPSPETFFSLSGQLDLCLSSEAVSCSESNCCTRGAKIRYSSNGR